MSKGCVVLEHKVKATRRFSPVALRLIRSRSSGGLSKQAVVKVRVLEKTDIEKAGKGARLRAIKSVKSKRLSAKRCGVMSVVKWLVYASYVSQS